MYARGEQRAVPGRLINREHVCFSKNYAASLRYGAAAKSQLAGALGEHVLYALTLALTLTSYNGGISLSVSILEKSLTFMVARGTLLLIKVLLLFQIELIVFIRHYWAVE